MDNDIALMNKIMSENALEVADYLEEYLEKVLLPGKTYIITARYNDFSIRSMDRKVEVTVSDMLKVFHYKKVLDFITLFADYMRALYRPRTLEVCGKRKVLDIIVDFKEYARNESIKYGKNKNI